jgi:hypothetical protein
MTEIDRRCTSGPPSAPMPVPVAHQALYKIDPPQRSNEPITAARATLPRIDQVVLQALDNLNAYSER